MTGVLVMGALGRMGREVMRAVILDPDLELAFAVDPAAPESGCECEVEGSRVRVSKERSGVDATRAEVMVDFTRAGAAVSNIEWALPAGIHCVVGTTGIPAAELSRLGSLSLETGANVIIAPNFAIGAVMMMKLAEVAAGVFDSCEIIEMHHRGKRDAPSGTAIMTAGRVAEVMRAAEVPPQEDAGVPGTRGGGVGAVNIHSVRLDGFVAHQEVIFGSQGETLTIRHASTDRRCFMRGVTTAVKAVAGMPGLTLGLEPLLGI